MRRHFIHHGLPGPLRHFRVVCGEVSASEVQVERWLPMRFVHRVKQPLGEERLRRLSRVGKQTDFRTDFVVRTVDLMSSELCQSGPAYRTLMSAALRSG